MTQAVGRSAEVNTEKDESPCMIGWGAGLKPRISWKTKPTIIFLMKNSELRDRASTQLLL
jgi:hypothetical protein